MCLNVQLISELCSLDNAGYKPADGAFGVENPSRAIYILLASGGIVLETVVNANTNGVDLDVKTIPNGLYHLSLKEGNTNLVSQKISIIH
jgi:hypothetical protein